MIEFDVIYKLLWYRYWWWCSESIWHEHENIYKIMIQDDGGEYWIDCEATLWWI